METYFDADDLAKGLYAFRSHVMSFLTDQYPLPEYLSAPLWEATNKVQRAIVELEARHNCQDSEAIYLGLGLGMSAADGTASWDDGTASSEEPDDP